MKGSADDALITLLIGKDNKKFVVHKTFACYYSPVFDAAFNGAFDNSKTQTYDLGEVEENTVALLVAWIYSQKIVTPEAAVNETFKAFQFNLVRLWVLADQLMIPQLQDVSIALLEESRASVERIPTTMLQYAYQNTTPQCKLREWFLYACARYFPSQKYSRTPENFPTEFLLALAAYFKKESDACEESPIRNRRTSDFYIERRGPKA